MADVFVLLVVVAQQALFWSALVSAIRMPGVAWTAAGRSKTAMIVLILLSGGVGGLYYFVRIRPRLGHTASRPARPVEDPKGAWRAYRKGDDPWAEVRRSDER